MEVDNSSNDVAPFLSVFIPEKVETENGMNCSDSEKAEKPLDTEMNGVEPEENGDSSVVHVGSPVKVATSSSAGCSRSTKTASDSTVCRAKPGRKSGLADNSPTVAESPGILLCFNKDLINIILA